MSPKRCAIRDCKAKGEKVCVHEIPTSIKRREKWTKALKPFIDDPIDEKTLICKKHFKKTDYVPSLTGLKPLLCKSAVPSIFPSNMPKKQPEVVVRPRHQSRRAASKEALKQMQILLEDENDAVEIPDDDEVIPIPVVVSAPKKKYKLTHRKSSDGNDREVLVLKSITPNITNHYVENNLELECWVEELEPCQKERNMKLEAEEKALESKLEELIKACKGEVVYKGDLTTVIEVSEHVQKTIQAVQASINKPPIVLNNPVPNPQPGYQLVMDPRLGLIVGTVPPGNKTPAKQGKIQVASNLQAPVTPTSQVTPPPSRRSRGKKQTPVIQVPPPPTSITTRSVPASRSGPSSVSTRSTPTPVISTRSTPSAVATRSAPSAVATRSAPSAVATRSAPSPIATRSAPSPISTRSAPSPIATRSAPSPIATRSAPSPIATRSAPSPVATRSAPSPIATRSVINTKQSNKRTAPQPPPAAPPATRSRRDLGGPAVNARPTETSVEGGLTTGTKPKAIVDLTSDDGRPLPDSREISFNKLQGKTFPSLVVVARPHLRVADVNSDRAKLDAKVKSVLMYAPTKFTEWLIQQGLVKSEQKCSIHTTTQLKLGMYSDVSKFPYSGGYVWISECCPQRFVSVFSGSIFEGSPHPPLVILKILYHWSCQTNIQNVTQWVKVDNLYVKGMYTWLRSICSVALQSHIRQLGGPQTKVEVGVISLGTTSQDGNSRQVKVEVLGILETSSKLIRLRAIEPLADGDRNYKKRFSKILEPLAQWVHPSSIIITDLTVDKATLHQMGFSTVVQTTSVDANNSNRTIMEYLRRIVPRMFQNTLSLLSRQIIQQFLDELVWREWFGTTSMQAFDNLITHLAEQTRFESNQSLIVKLNRVALNPFKNWGVSATSTTPAPAVAPSTAAKPVDTVAKKRKRKDPEPPKPAAAPAAEVNRPPKSTSPDVPEQMVPLENYYYGTIDNYPPKTNVTLNMKCPFCKETFNNNIVLMNHLFKHAHNVSQDGQMCRYCLTSVPTANDLLKHISTSHPSETKHDNGFVCLICETQYMNPFVLGKHMSKEHCPSELPYQCGTCGYKCSNHKQAIDHFYKQHDNGPTIQCPFCLKSTTVFSSSRNIAQNMHYFIQHLQKHQRKQYARRCGKCNLWFVQKDVLKEHQTKMHASQRGKTGLIPWIAPRNGVMVPKSKMDKYPCDAEGINFTTLFFNVSKGLNCKECDGLMDSPKHFPSFESCQNPNCQYSSCCSNAMQEHNAKCSKNSQPNIPEEKLPYEMFCICGYSSEDGNQMAKHLAVCERKSAYPSLSDAKSASVTHSMLDVLGLVRKPEETEKKQTALTRNIKRITNKPELKPEPEPETITLDEDEPTEEGVAKKIKKDIKEPGSKEATEVAKKIEQRIKERDNKKQSKTNSTEKLTKSVEVDTLETVIDDKSDDGINPDPKEINKESEEINTETGIMNTKSNETEKDHTMLEKETDIIEKEGDRETDIIEKEGDRIPNETDEIENETDIIEKDNDVIEKATDIVEKGTDIVKKEADIKEKEAGTTESSGHKPVNEKEDNIDEVSDTDISMAEQRSTSVEFAEISDGEKEQYLPQASLAEEPTSFQPQPDGIEQSEAKNTEEKDSRSEKSDVDQSEITDDEETKQLADDNALLKEAEGKQSQTIETEDKNVVSVETNPKQKEITETEDKVESEDAEVEQLHTRESEITETEDKVESEDAEVEQLHTRESEITETEDKVESEDEEVGQLHTKESEITETDDKVESEDAEVEQLHTRESEITETEDKVESEDAEVEQLHTRESDKAQSEDSDFAPVESPNNRNEENKEEKITEISEVFQTIAKSQQEDDIQSSDKKIDTPTDLEDVTTRDSDVEINKEQEQEIPDCEEGVGESLKDKFEDMSKLNTETTKIREHEIPERGEIVEDPSNDFENISDKDENVTQLPDVSSPVEDFPSTTPGVYDDVSESSDNAASKYSEDPETVLNLGEEQAADMEVEETDNQERAREAMDYEDISNTGLDTLTSMDTD